MLRRVALIVIAALTVLGLLYGAFYSATYPLNVIGIPSEDRTWFLLAYGWMALSQLVGVVCVVGFVRSRLSRDSTRQA